MAHLSANVPDEQHEQLLARARASDRSLSAEVRRMLRMYLQALESRPSVESVIESSRSLEREPISVA